jgi:squalene-hopene/tetraprenyl-beta-curcumene cyclase
MGRLSREGRGKISDTDIYDVIAASAEELVRYVAPRSFAGGQDLDEHSFRLSNLSGALVASWIKVPWGIAPIASESYRPAATELMTLNAALSALLRDQMDGFRNMAHMLTFPRLMGGQVVNATHAALLSFRAVALDALLDAAEAGLQVCDRVLAQEALWILRAKHREVRGGWNYVQEAPELPPDADDLGQVLQVLWRLGGRELASTCEDGIILALDSAEAHGGFNTWILDSEGRTEADRLILDYLPIMGGWGVHTEVVANLLYGLLVYHRERFLSAVVRTIPYFEGTQTHEGFWLSKWYRGPFYGTFRVLSVLGEVAPHHPAVAKAAAYLLGSQKSDGGWGEQVSEPLSTAFAILGLVASRQRDTADAATHGQRYLRLNQEKDGHWESCEWISFPSRDGPVVYGSATMTTAFSLKALLAGTSRKRTSLLGREREMETASA